ncbi:hypothetical protein HCN44_003426 [Aphidius gifuensis]|uniref:Uncharacterized protein n=1 Tax=Aphidius gifuensis TaxID=684658 RepID=A0A834XJY3_APHGI|nr:hypothetical protein HCN44_003426 [Aphidius gifuensis]
MRLDQRGLAERYGNDVEFATAVEMLIALPFNPVDLVVGAYDTIISSRVFINNNDDFVELLKYFEQSWIGDRLDRMSNIMIIGVPEADNDNLTADQRYQSDLMFLHDSESKVCPSMDQESVCQQRPHSSTAGEKEGAAESTERIKRGEQDCKNRAWQLQNSCKKITLFRRTPATATKTTTATITTTITPSTTTVYSTSSSANNNKSHYKMSTNNPPNTNLHTITGAGLLAYYQNTRSINNNVFIKSSREIYDYG